MNCEVTQPAWYQSLVFKVTLRASAALALAAIVLTAVAFAVARGTVREEVHKRLLLAAADREAMISTYISQQMERITVVASRSSLRSLIDDDRGERLSAEAMRTAARPILASALQRHDGLAAVWICDSSGKVIAATNDEYLGRDFANNTAFQRGREGSYFDDPRPIEGRFGAYLSAPVRTEHGQVSAVVMALLDATQLARIVEDRGGFGETAQVFVATPGREGLRCLLPQHHEEIVPAGVPELAAMDASLRGPASVQADATGDDGRDMVVIYRKIPIPQDAGREWALAARVDAAEAYHPIRRVGFWLAALALGLLVSGTCATAWGAATATRSLRKLTEAAVATSSGRLDMRAALGSKSECGVLARTFNGMLDRLVEMYAQSSQSAQKESQLSDINEMLRSTTAFQRAVLDSAAYSIITCDLDGRISSFNQGAERLLGYRAEEVVGTVTPELIHDREEIVARAQALSEELGLPVSPGFETFVAKARHGQTDEREWTYICKDGSRVPVLLAVTAIRGAEGDITGFMGMAKDITQRRQAEQQLQEAKRQAEEASRTKSEFLANMSHELRTPLNGVIGMTELLAATNLDRRQRKFVDACRASGESLLSLINDILDLSKIEAGKLQLDFHDFELEKLVTDTVDTMAWRAAEKHLEMPCYVDQAPHTIVKGDGARLRQVLVNLLSNAIKFTSAGEVTVRTRTTARAEDRITVRFSVSDTGIGIAADQHELLFQSFSQLDASTTRHFGGTGLGLAISQSLVEMMGGTIGVESEEGVGSTFWFELSFDVVSETSEGPAEASALAGRRTLVVDDHKTNRLILAEYLSLWGVEAAVATSVDEALAVASQAEADGKPFHVVLTDFNMPQKDGLELARALKDHPQLLVLLLGSTDIHMDPAELREHGIDGALRKPIRRNELHTVLSGLLGNAVERAAPAPGEEVSSPEADRARPSGHVLVAEDNTINRLYVVEALDQLGCTCDTVANGREATEAVQRGRYDLVLMDCRMPELDGFQATRCIRRLESDGLLEGHLPIVALTANALTGDRQRCLDAGMDDYLGKPVQMNQLSAVIERYLADRPPPPAESAAEVASAAAGGSSPGPVPIDAESLLGRCFGNVTFAASLLDELESTGTARVEELRRSSSEQNLLAAAETAHALKGAAGILCADSLCAAAERIEQAGYASDLADLEAGLSELAAEMQRCLNYVPQLRDDLNKVKAGS